MQLGLFPRLEGSVEPIALERHEIDDRALEIKNGVTKQHKQKEQEGQKNHRNG